MLLNCNYESDISYNSHKVINQPLEIINLTDTLSSSINSDKSLQPHAPVINEIILSDSLLFENTNKFIEPIKNFENISETFTEKQTCNEDNKIPLNIKLKNWALECNVAHSTLNKLLYILNKEDDPSLFQTLPLDSRTLLNSGSLKTTNIINIHPGTYYHFGLSEGIKRHLLKFKNNNDVKVIIGVDGLPLSKSSGSQFWPILAYIYPYSNNVFPVGIFHGYKKPDDSNAYLKYFIEEAEYLALYGIELDSISFKVSIMAFCCDSPAKSFVLKVKSHTGFSSCTRCFHDGEYSQNRICFPYQENGFKIRDHDGYVNMVQKSHHIRGDVTSDLIKLPNFDIVRSFPLDYMHLVLLGVMRKLVHLWMSKGPLSVRLHSKKCLEITEMLLIFKPYIPIEFARKPRAIEEICRWKATELRQFLLYTGPIVLKDILSEECYNNFMCLSIAMTILLSGNHTKKVEFASRLLHYFVKNFGDIYGSHFISHNIHGLLHIVDDYERFGPLDFCSCFPFENHMKFFKSALRKHDKPLQQVVRRYNEEFFNNEFASTTTPKSSYTAKTHNQGPMLENITCNPQFVSLKLRNITININKLADSFIFTKKNQIVKVINIAHSCLTKEPLIIGYKFLEKKPLYDSPIKSTKLGIYVFENMSDQLQSWKIDEIMHKLMVLIFKNRNIAIPIIHSI